MATRKYKGNENFNIDWSAFRTNLQILIDRKGMTKADLARELDLAISTVSRYFYETTPDMTALWLIADYFDVQIDWLLGRSQNQWKELSQEQRLLIDRYSILSTSDKLIVDTILNKYTHE